jgi:large subunit ribosomal protein L20
MRVKRGHVKRQKHKKVLKAASGYSQAKSKRYRSAKNQLDKSMQYATRDRKAKKRLIRKLWITRVNAACRTYGVSYSRFISGLKKANIALNRKVIQEIALIDMQAIEHIVSLTQSSK